jgi:hypothetical protein
MQNTIPLVNCSGNVCDDVMHGRRLPYNTRVWWATYRAQFLWWPVCLRYYFANGPMWNTVWFPCAIRNVWPMRNMGDWSPIPHVCQNIVCAICSCIAYDYIWQCIGISAPYRRWFLGRVGRTPLSHTHARRRFKTLSRKGGKNRLYSTSLHQCINHEDWVMT